jgi:hypothetical protein
VLREITAMNRVMLDLVQPFTFPGPPTHQDFEALIAELLSSQEPDASVQLYGRSGQSQYGVDVVVARSNGTTLGYQCKDVRVLSARTVATEASRAAAFPGDLSRFIIYTSAPRDTKSQDAARLATKTAPFLVEVMAWDDISALLMKDLPVAQAYMRRLPMHDVTSAYLWQLRMAFDRPAFTDSADTEWSHADQLLAITDVEFFLSTGLLRTRDSIHVLSSLPVASITAEKQSLSKLKSLLSAMKGDVTQSAKAERRSDYAAVQLRYGTIDDARLKMLGALNDLLTKHGMPALVIR